MRGLRTMGGTDGQLCVDFVVVGAGAAGCVLADRLSASGRHSVALIEAGGPDRHPAIRVPALVGLLIGNRQLDWGYSTEPQAHAKDRHIPLPRGRVLGGLTATVDPAFTTIRMSSGRFESALRGDMVREQKLLDAKAPGEFRHGEFLWSPQVCIEDQCRVMKLSLHGFNERRLMYYPRQNRLLELFPIGYVASESRFRAEAGPPS